MRKSCENRKWNSCRTSEAVRPRFLVVIVMVVFLTIPESNTQLFTSVLNNFMKAIDIKTIAQAPPAPPLALTPPPALAPPPASAPPPATTDQPYWKHRHKIEKEGSSPPPSSNNQVLPNSPIFTTTSTTKVPVAATMIQRDPAPAPSLAPKPVLASQPEAPSTKSTQDNIEKKVEIVTEQTTTIIATTPATPEADFDQDPNMVRNSLIMNQMEQPHFSFLFGKPQNRSTDVSAYYGERQGNTSSTGEPLK